MYIYTLYLDSVIKAHIYSTQPFTEDTHEIKKEEDKKISTIKFLGKMKYILHKANKSEKDLSFLFKTQEDCDTESTKSNQVKTARVGKVMIKKSLSKQSSNKAVHTKSAEGKLDEVTFANMLSEIHKILNRNTSYKDIKRGSAKQKANHVNKASAELLRCENILWIDAKKRMNQDYFYIKDKSNPFALKTALNKAHNEKGAKLSHSNKKKHTVESASQLQKRPGSSTK